ARPSGAVFEDAIGAIGAATRVRVPDAGAALQDVAAVASAAAARPVARRVRVRIRRCRARTAAGSARVDAGVRDAGVGAGMRARSAARTGAARTELARTVGGHYAGLAVRTGASLRRADSAAINAGLVLVADRVRAEIRHAGSAADMEPGLARNEHAGSAGAGPHAVRVQGRAVQTTRP